MLDLLKTRRSIRKYQDKEVEKSKLDTILKAALLSPSSKSRRPWEFIAVTDQEVLEKLSLCKKHGSKPIGKAPLAIVVAADPEACDVWIEDCSIASIIIQLTAQSLDLGSCWIQVRERLHSEGQKAEEYIKDILDIPQEYVVESVITIGYPAEEKKPYDLEQLPFEKIHYDKY